MIEKNNKTVNSIELTVLNKKVIDKDIKVYYINICLLVNIIWLDIYKNEQYHHNFKYGALAQRESTWSTTKGSLVRSQYAPSIF